MLWGHLCFFELLKYVFVVMCLKMSELRIRWAKNWITGPEKGKQASKAYYVAKLWYDVGHRCFLVIFFLLWFVSAIQCCLLCRTQHSNTAAAIISSGVPSNREQKRSVWCWWNEEYEEKEDQSKASFDSSLCLLTLLLLDQ